MIDSNMPHNRILRAEAYFPEVMLIQRYSVRVQVCLSPRKHTRGSEHCTFGSKYRTRQWIKNTSISLDQKHVNVTSATTTEEEVSSIYIYLIDLLIENPVPIMSDQTLSVKIICNCKYIAYILITREFLGSKPKKRNR